MRNILFASAALAVLAFSAPAFATVDSDTIQVNAGVVQGADLTIHSVHVNGELTGGAQAVGNDISLTAIGSDPGNSSPTRRNGDDIRAAELQVNLGALQIANTDINNSFLGSVDVSSEAIGNTLSASTEANFDPGFHQGLTGGAILQAIAGQDDGSTAIQVNGLAVQDATLKFNDNTVYGGSNLGTVAVGNNLNVSANQNGTFSGGQLNFLALETADTQIHGSTFGGNSNVSATSIGNIASDTANSPDFGALQGNVLTAQLANIDISSSHFGGNLNALSVSAGNVVNVSNVGK